MALNEIDIKKAITHVPPSYHFVSFGKNEENLALAIKHRTIGSEIGRIESYISEGSVLFLHCKSRLFGIAVTVSDYFHSNEPIWPDRIYPHRFKVKVITMFNKPVKLADTSSKRLLEERFGKSWAPKLLFSPQPVPSEIGSKLLRELTTELHKSDQGRQEIVSHA